MREMVSFGAYDKVPETGGSLSKAAEELSAGDEEDRSRASLEHSRRGIAER